MASSCIPLILLNIASVIINAGGCIKSAHLKLWMYTYSPKLISNARRSKAP